MKTKAILIAALLATTACSSSSTDKKVPEMKALNPEENETVTQSVAKEDDSEAEADVESYADFDEFWAEFREAVQENDIQEVLELTNFPFETRGEMDSDPIIKYNEKQMTKVMPLLFQQGVILPGKGTELLESTEGQIIINMKTVPKKDILEEYTRPGGSNFVFKKTKNGWKCAFAYVNEPTYEKIGKP